MKKKFTALLLTLATTLSLCSIPLMAAPAMAAKTPTFSDVPATHWAFACIESCYAKGIMQGVGNGKFDPERLVTGAEVVQTLYNLYRDRVPATVVEVLRLHDVPDDAWFHEAAYWSVRSGISNYSSRPGNLLLGETDYMIYSLGPSSTWGGRAYAATCLGRVADALGVKLPETVDPVTFPDGDHFYLRDDEGNILLSQRRDLSPDITEYIYAMQRAGIISGFPDGTFRPEEGLTRAQWAKMVDLFTDIEGIRP